MDHNTYTTQVNSEVFVDFSVEVLELDGPDYDFEVNDMKLVCIDEEGFEKDFIMSSIPYEAQQSLMDQVDEAINNFLSDNAEKLLSKHADPEFLEKLDKASEYDTYLH
jgi:hypothetical protein